MPLRGYIYCLGGGHTDTHTTHTHEHINVWDFRKPGACCGRCAPDLTIIESNVTRMLEQSVFIPSTSLWSSPVIMVSNNDGSWRFCVDYFKLNMVTHQGAYPLPK